MKENIEPKQKDTAVQMGLDYRTDADVAQSAREKLAKGETLDERELAMLREQREQNNTGRKDFN